VLRAQRLKLEAEFERQLIDGVTAEKQKMTADIDALLNRVNAVESAVNGQLIFVYLLTSDLRPD